MPLFDEEKQIKKLESLRSQEEEALARILSQKYGIPYVDLSQESINNDALRLLSEEQARAAEAAAFSLVGKKVALAVRVPSNPKVEELKTELQNRGFLVSMVMVSKLSLDRAWAQYSDLSFATESKAGMLDISADAIIELSQKIGSIGDAREQIMQVLKMKRAYRTSRILETLVAAGLSTEASDIHVEPEEDYVRMRLRLDGVLTDLLTFDRDTYNLLLSRIKLLSGLKLNIKNAPQDGRFSVHIQEKDIEIRTSILPGAYGESIVMRILDPHSIAMPMEELGMEERLLATLNDEIHRPNGLILNTGPTGSGKTTTLYAFLRRIHTPKIKIITIEDPVEYHLPGIVQTQVDHKHYSFADGLRSTLRQDPDVIMVGEIRDHEVASTAVHAALTGHLVFSTLHTNNAAGAFPRLIDIGIDRDILGSAVNAVMAQRLVRILRPDFCEQVELVGKEKDFVQGVLETIPHKEDIPENTSHVWKPREGGEGETGYKGRLGVYETILMTEAVDEAIKSGGGIREVLVASQTQGILNMQQDAVLKALRGTTSMEEIERVLGLEIGRVRPGA